MKRLVLIGCLAALFLSSNAQSQEAEQLLLDWQKLTALKKVLKNLYEGFKILHQGYTTIKNISEGNFSLHRNFLDALLQVSPAVKKYKRVGDIISYQLRLVQECKRAMEQIKSAGNFSPGELAYMAGVYKNLATGSLKSLDELTIVLTSGTLRMSDEERLRAIDRIYDSTINRSSFLREFTNRNLLLSGQKTHELRQLELSKTILSAK